MSGRHDAMARPEPGAESELAVTDVTTDGEGIARWPGGLVVFVPGGLPGDRVLARFESMRGRVGRAHLVAVREPAAERRPAPCPYQDTCGGCPLMPLPESRVLALKAQQVKETLRRVGKLDVTIDGKRASPSSLRYRNRARFVLDLTGEASRLAYRARGDGESIVAIDDCLLLPEGAVALARRFADRLAGAGAEAKRGAKKHAPSGPTHLSLRGSLARDEWLLVLHGPAGRWKHVPELAADFVASEARAAGIVRVLERGGHVVGSHLLAGRGHVEERIAGREVPLDATGFLQVNPEAATLLYEEVGRALLRDGEPGRLLDLFCGVGLTGIAAAPPRTRIVGVETNARAARAAAELAAREGRIAEYLAGDARRALREMAARGERFDALIANPPRAGLGADLAGHALELGVRRAVLVSCHPATLARDACAFAERGFRVDHAAVVDVFPQTAEVETVLGLAAGGAQ